jgi:drug/metabolite transporter (DMT)-like permease
VSDGPTPDRPLVAVGWMALAVLSFAAMTLAGRELSAALDTFEIMTWRSAIGFPLVAAALLATAGAAGARTRRPGLHATRNLVHFGAQNLWFYGIATIPLAQLTALEFTSPLWVALLAPLVVGERLTARKLAAAAIGFCGVLAIARPGVAPIEAGHAAGLGAALGFAITNLATKRLSRTDGALCVLFWMTASQLAMGALAAEAAGGLDLPPAALAPWVIVAGVAGLTAHVGLTRALYAAPASVVAPMEFARLPVVAAAALVAYGEPIGAPLVVGAALILAGNLAGLGAGRKGRG